MSHAAAVEGRKIENPREILNAQTEYFIRLFMLTLLVLDIKAAAPKSPMQMLFKPTPTISKESMLEFKSDAKLGRYRAQTPIKRFCAASKCREANLVQVATSSNINKARLTATIAAMVYATRRDG